MEKLGVPEVRREQPHGHHHNWRCVHDGGRGKVSGAIRRQEDKYKNKPKYKDKHKYKD